MLNQIVKRGEKRTLIGIRILQTVYVLDFICIYAKIKLFLLLNNSKNSPCNLGFPKAHTLLTTGPFQQVHSLRLHHAHRFCLDQAWRCLSANEKISCVQLDKSLPQRYWAEAKPESLRLQG